MTTDALPSLREQMRRIRDFFLRVRNAEKRYLPKLTAVARQIGVLIKGLAPGGDVKNPAILVESLNRYADVIDPWARAVAARMVNDVNLRDKNAWRAMSQEINQGLRHEIENAPTGQVMQELIEAQVEEIKSIPRSAAQRVYELATEAHISGRRSSEIAEEILRTEDVSVARAKMIARTAVASASSALVESRARYIGSTHYEWVTSQDEDVRKDHQELNGKIFSWDNPPIVDKRTGFRSHPGANANCRCWPRVILPSGDD